MSKEYRYVPPQLALNGLYHMLLWVGAYYLTYQPSDDPVYQQLHDRLSDLYKELYNCDYMYAYDELARGVTPKVEFPQATETMGLALAEISIFGENVPAPEETWQGILVVLGEFYRYRRSWANDFNRPSWSMKFYHLLERYHSLPLDDVSPIAQT